jgi:hypothetical protein
MTEKNISLIRQQCAKALKARRNYKKIHPDNFTVWQCSEIKGAALLASRISKILKNH